MPDSTPLETALLNQPLQLPNGSVIRNRLAKASMSETLATYGNRPTAKLTELYRRWASSGIGLLITGNVMIDRRALGEPGNVVIEDESDLPLLRQWASAATGQGAAIWIQLNHPGKQATKGLNANTLAPSAVPFREDMQALFETPRAATHAEIEDVIRRFGRSAAICKNAGFSGVQIHGAHGYLVSQFLSPHHNRRDDQWGGSPEKRRRFVLEVYGAIRRQVGRDFPISIKLNSADFQRGGFNEDESLATMQALVDAGIDLIEISGGTYEAPAMSGAVQQPTKASTVAREAYFLQFAEKARSALKTPLMVTGGFCSAAGMNAALRSGALDLIGLARLLAIDPDAPAALLKGRDSPQRVRPIKTGIPMIDRMGIMEIFWYTLQLGRIANGGNPRPNENGFGAFLKAVMKSGWGTFRTRRLRAKGLESSDSVQERQVNNMKWKDVPTRTVDVGGVPFAYRELGPASGVPVIFLHHLMAVLDDWDPRVIDGIAAHRRVIAFDNRGVGSSGGSVPYTVEEMGRDAIAFIHAMGLKQVDLLGFSLGGGVAQMVALQAPDLVRRMILAGTAPKGGGGVEQVTKVAVMAYIKAAFTLSDPRNFLFFPRTPEGKRAAKDYFTRLKERTRDRDDGISLQARRAQLEAIKTAGLGTPDDLSVITQPVFVVNGDHDLMVASSLSADIARRLPNAKLAIYPDCGHGGVFQHHRAFVPAVLEFLAN